MCEIVGVLRVDRAAMSLCRKGMKSIDKGLFIW